MRKFIRIRPGVFYTRQDEATKPNPCQTIRGENIFIVLADVVRGMEKRLALLLLVSSKPLHKKMINCWKITCTNIHP